MHNFALEEQETELIRSLRSIAPSQRRAIFELVHKLSVKQRARESAVEPAVRLVHRGKMTP